MTLRTSPIEDISVNHVSDHTVSVTVKTDAPVHTVWPYVRASAQVPYVVTVVSSVYSRKLETEVLEEVIAALVADAEWRWDRGYVNAAKYTDGWVFVWSEGDRD